MVLKHCLWISIFMLLAANANAQTDTSYLFDSQPGQTPDSVAKTPEAKQDSIRKRFYTRKVTYHIGDNDLDIYPIDTNLDNKQYYDPVYTQGGWAYRNIGNIGLPTVPIFYQPSLSQGFDLGYHTYDLYNFHRHSLRFYDSRIPYTHLFFLFGQRKEQMVDVTHNQNIGQRFNIAFQFRRYSSEGTYASQQTNHNNFALTTRYISRSQQYKLTAIFLFNSNQQQENGGVDTTDIFANDQGISSSLTAVTLDGAQTKYKDQGFFLKQEWRQGKADTIKINDSTRALMFYPSFTLYHELSFGAQRYTFFDQNPTGSYYDQFQVDADSLFSTVAYTHWANTLGITKTSIKSIDSTGVHYRNYLIDASIYQSLGSIVQDPKREPLQQIRLQLSLRNHPSSNSPFIYHSKVTYDLVDYNQNDLIAEGSIGLNLKKIGRLLVSGGFSRKELPWLYNSFQYQRVNIDNQFNKTININAGLSYEIPRYRFLLSGWFYNITYPGYFNQNRVPTQLSGSVQVWVVQLSKNFRWRHFGSDNLFVLQFFTGQDILRFPKFWSKNSLFYENNLFKGNLVLRAGVDVFYNTNYKGYGYFPLTGQFYIQDNLTLSYYPVADVFVSLKIAEAIVFLKMEHVNQGIFSQKGYYATYGYPAADRAFKVGVSWRFYN
ncbi:MAG: putative porin [Chitinophagales bacterium]|nr:putative porin [Chitinophagales bacterium]